MDNKFINCYTKNCGNITTKDYLNPESFIYRLHLKLNNDIIRDNIQNIQLIEREILYLVGYLCLALSVGIILIVIIIARIYCKTTKNKKLSKAFHREEVIELKTINKNSISNKVLQTEINSLNKENQRLRERLDTAIRKNINLNEEIKNKDIFIERITRELDEK